MNYRNQESIKEIQNIIRPFKTKWPLHIDKKSIETDINWNASIFFSKLLFKAQCPESYWTKQDIENFANNYNLTNSVSINADALINQHWIREVLGQIQIPKAVRDVIYDFEKMQSHRQELVFVRELYFAFPNQKVSEDEFSIFLSEYEKTNNIALDTPWLKSNWVKQKTESDESLKIGNIDYYFTLLDNWNEFEFLYAFKNEKLKNESKGLVISKNELECIHNTHKSYFLKSPSLDLLKEQEVFSENGSEYYINFYNSKVSYWNGLGDKISGLIWEELIIDNTISDDKKRVKIFLSKILYWENNWPKFYKHLTANSKERFVKTAFDLILEEKDITPVKDEFAKCYLDDNVVSRYAFKSGIDLSEEILKSSKNYYEFYEEMFSLSDKHQGNLFHSQDVRNHLAFLIKTIVCCDSNFSNVTVGDTIKTEHFPLVKSLLKQGLEKPYLLWETCHFIAQNRPTIIPSLLEEPQFASLAFKLISKVKIESTLKNIDEEVKLQLFEKTIRLSLDSILNTPDYSNEYVALLIFQFFKEITTNKYQSLSRIPLQETRIKIRKTQKKKEALLIELIESHSAYGNNVRTNNREFLLPKIINELVELFKNHKEKVKYLNGTIQFPILTIDGLSWISKVVNYSKYEGQLSNIIEIKELISNLFKEAYLEKIEQKLVTKKDFRSNELIESLPSWSERNERLNQIDWVYLMVIMYDTNTLKYFLSPRFSLKKADDEYNEENRFNAKKIRTHLFVLLITLQKITLNKSDYFNVYDRIRPVKAQLEEQIVLILKDYAIAGKSSKIDILSYSFERQLSGITEEELLPQIAQAINWFKEKNKVIDVLIKTSDLLRLLIILDWVTSEGIKKQIIDKVKDSQVLEYLQAQNWLPEIELTLTKLSHYKELVKQTETALSFWENINPPRENAKFEQASFIVKLVLAYNDKDIKRINSLTVPEHQNYPISGIKPFNYKQFFIGLIHFDSNPEKAYKIFDMLYIQFLEHTSICINRFASKINWATKTVDISIKNQLFNEALQEWLEVEKLLPESSIQPIMDKVWVNKLTIYYHLKDFEEFEKLYVTLPTPYQMIGDIISLKIEILLLQGKQQEAIQQLHLAIEYHQMLDGSNPDFITELKTKVDDKSDIKLLKASYNEIFSKKPKTLIQILPERLNGEIEIGKFITKEFAIATNKALDKILAIDEIKNEDKYNDLVQVALESRFGIFGWIVKDQTRGAFSAEGSDLGERDIVIQNSNNETMIVCEAFIYRDIPRTQSHLKKIFNYHHQKKHFIILIYDLGTQGRFKKKWQKYLNETLPKLKYPKGFDIKASKSKDLTDELNYDESAIKIGMTNHGDNTVIYHLMINLKFKI
tara:strand:- start:267 stop:4307 length:4041 start_codon:yes stop_codon:yes gene_type:complete